MCIRDRYYSAHIPNRTSEPYGLGTTMQKTKTGSNVLQKGKDRKYEENIIIVTFFDEKYVAEEF